MLKTLYRQLKMSKSFPSRLETNSTAPCETDGRGRQHRPDPTWRSQVDPKSTYQVDSQIYSRVLPMDTDTDLQNHDNSLDLTVGSKMQRWALVLDKFIIFWLPCPDNYPILSFSALIQPKYLLLAHFSR
jgi:hypothetical protein